MNAHDLPAEILLSIFKLVVEDLRHEVDSVIVGTVLAGVCRRWRELALTSQKLWAVLPRSDLSFTTLCLSRCSSASLDFNIKTLFLKTEESRLAVRAIYPHLSRVKRLTLAVHEARLYKNETCPIGLDELAEALREQPLHTLEKLSFKLVTYPGEARGPPRPIPQELSQALLPPSLRIFTCNNTILDRYRRPTFCNIRRIDFTRVEAWDEYENMADFFRSIPLLESFSHIHFLTGDMPTIPSPDALPTPRSIKLKHLREFRMEGLALHAYAAFVCLEFPPSATLIITDDNFGMSDLCVEMLDENERDSYILLLATIKSALRDHFAIAIAHNIHYDGVRLCENIIRPLAAIDDSGDLIPSRWVHADVVPAPGNLELQLPPNGTFNTSEFGQFYVAHGTDCLLPIFSAAKTVALVNWVEPSQVDFFTSARNLQLESLNAMVSFSRGPSRAALRSVRVVGFPVHPERNVLDEYCKVAVRLRDFERNARLVLVKCNLEEEELDKLRDILGSRLVVCDDSDSDE